MYSRVWSQTHSAAMSSLIASLSQHQRHSIVMQSHIMSHHVIFIETECGLP